MSNKTCFSCKQTILDQAHFGAPVFQGFVCEDCHNNQLVPFYLELEDISEECDLYGEDDNFDLR